MTRTAILAVLSLCTRLIPRTDALWVIGGSKGVKYGDNAMYFLKYCARYANRRVVWLARTDKIVREVRADGYEAHRFASLVGIWLGLRAKWHIYDVTPSDTGPTNPGANLLNLWHGVPLKDIRFLKKKLKLKGFNKWMNTWIFRTNTLTRRSFFVHPDKVHIQHIIDSFDLESKNIIYANLPRNVLMTSIDQIATWCKSEDKLMIEQLQTASSKGSRIIGYFPTWRGGMKDQFLGTMDVEKIRQFNAFLKSQNCILLTKWHDCLYAPYNHSGVNEDAEKLIPILQEQSNITVLGFEADLNSHLPHCDILVTDYSSVLFDYLFTDNPIIFLAYDLQEYKNRWGLLFDYESFVPGNIVRNIDELVSVIESWVSGDDLGFSKTRSQYRSIFFEYSAGMDEIVRRMEEL